MRIGPPVEHPIARANRRELAALQNGIEHRRGRAERLIEIQRFPETDDVLDALSRREMLRIQPAQTFARVGQVVGRVADTKTLEVRPRGHEIGAVAAAGHQARELRGIHRRLELPLVVEHARAAERIVGGRRRNRRRAHQRHDERHQNQTVHAGMVAYWHSPANILRFNNLASSARRFGTMPFDDRAEDRSAGRAPHLAP